MQTYKTSRSLVGKVLLATLLSLATLLGALTTVSAQEVPQVLPYQGYLARSTGAPVEGSVTMTFSLYDTIDSQVPVWTETLANVPVADGVFYAYLGQQTDIMQYFGDGTTRYLGIAVNNDPEASPRQSLGSVPYALLAGNALELGGYGPDYYATQNDIANFVTDSELAQTLNNYVTQEQFGGGVDLENYVTDQELADALAGLDFVTQDQLNNYVTQDQLNNYVTQNDFTTLQQTVNNLQNQITNLQTQIEQINNNNDGVAPAYILGKSNQTSNGRFNFGGKKGAAAATAMCQATFANEATAHLCSPDEVARAISTESWDAGNLNNITNVATWTISTQQFSRNNNFLNSTADSSCQGLNYNSGDIARGTNLTIFVNTLVGGNGGQANSTYFNVTRDVGCGQNRPVMCCR